VAGGGDAMTGRLRGALREGDHVEYDDAGKKVTLVRASTASVYINGVRAAQAGTPLEAGGAVGDHEHDVYIGSLPGGGAGIEPPPVFHLHLDADRDGQVDADWQRNDEWTWDRRYPGAMVMVNLDPDAKYGPRDPKHLAPLAIRRDPATKGRDVAGWKGYLRVSSKFKLRVLDGAGQSILIGPDSKEDRLPFDLGKDESTFTMEAVQFPGLYPGAGRDPDPATATSMTGFDGKLQLFLELYDPKGKLAQQEVAQLRVAPWVAFNHTDPTESVFVNGWAESQGIRDTLAKQAGVPVRVIQKSGDQWTQDQGEMGFSAQAARGGQRCEQRSLLTLKDDALLEVASARLLPFQTLPAIPDANLDFGGNLESTPPFVHGDNHRVYAFGRIYYGHPMPDPQHPPRLSPMQAATRVFLQQQAIQDPFQLDTGWLSVGHVDEMVCCVPMKDAPRGFRVLHASPALATRIVAPLPDDMPIFGPYAADYRRTMARILRYNQSASQPLDFSKLVIGAGLLKGQTPFNLRTYDFLAMTAFVEAKLAVVRDTFKRECGLRDADFIPVPVMFQGNLVAGHAVSGLAFTPGLVNALVITAGPTTWGGARQITLVAPKPFGPQKHADGSPPRAGDCLFEEAMIEAVGPASKTGVEVRFADDFQGYHELEGEVHCGTNTLRVPPSDRVWWAPGQDTRRSQP
jgi:protein-arginine deiminase